MAVDRDLARKLLTDATGRYESASRWALLACVTLFIFHLMTFSPFIRAQVESSAAIKQMTALQKMEGQLEVHLSSQKATLDQLRARLQGLLEAKKAAFGALQHAVDEITQARSAPSSVPAADLGMHSASGAVPEHDFTLQQPRSQRLQAGRAELPVQAPMHLQAQVQMQVQSADLAETPPWIWEGRDFRELIETGAVREAVLLAQTGDDLRVALEPIVNDYIITPQFISLNRHWLELGRQLSESALHLKAEIEELQTQLPEEVVLHDLASAANSYLDSIGNITFAPPAERFWWQSASLKELVIGRLSEEAENAIISPPPLREADSALQRLIDSRKQLVSSRAEIVDKLKEQFKEQQERLGDLIAPIKGVALDLSIVVVHFPLILGALLGLAIAWPARRRNELMRTLWLARRAGLVDTAAEGALAGGHSRIRFLLTTVGIAALFVCWIVLAAYQLSAWPDRSGLDLLPSGWREWAGTELVPAPRRDWPAVDLILLGGLGIALVLASAVFRVIAARPGQLPQEAEA